MQKQNPPLQGVMRKKISGFKEHWPWPRATCVQEVKRSGILLEERNPSLKAENPSSTSKNPKKQRLRPESRRDPPLPEPGTNLKECYRSDLFYKKTPPGKREEETPTHIDATRIRSADGTSAAKNGSVHIADCSNLQSLPDKKKMKPEENEKSAPPHAS